MSDTPMPRRSFLGRCAAGAASTALGGLLVPSARAPGANDRVNIALIGCGARGTYLYGEVRRQGQELNAEVNVLCDVWRPAREKLAVAIQEATGQPPRQFGRYTDVLALDDVDAVVIATPDFAHSRILAAAAAAGKDAYCEKPMASNLADAKAALKAVEQNRRIVQVGTQRRSEGAQMAAAELLRTGLLGKITAVEVGWCDAGPRWARDYGDVKAEDVDWEGYLMDLPPREFDPARFRRWHLYKDYTVGQPGLLGSHVIDLATWYMADPLPVNCVAHGGIYIWQDGREHADTITCLYEYPQGWQLTYLGRLGNSCGRPEATFFGLRGTFDTASFKATGRGGGQDKLTEEVGITPQPDVNHMRNWLECLRSRAQPNAPVQAGYAHSVASIMGFLAWETGQRQVYDPERQEIRAG